MDKLKEDIQHAIYLCKNTYFAKRYGYNINIYKYRKLYNELDISNYEYTYKTFRELCFQDGFIEL